MLLRTWRAPLWAAMLIASCGSNAGAQTTPIWPGADLFVKLGTSARIHAMASTVKEDGESTEAEFGVDVDLYAAPLRRKQPMLIYRLDESKNRSVMLRAGYHYLPSYAGNANEKRAIVEGTARLPVLAPLGHALLSHRARMDFRDLGGEYSWRYRSRLSLERESSIGPLRLNPYARFEAFYDSRFDEWSRTEWMLGSAFPLTSHWELEMYFDYQLDTGGTSSSKTKAVGAVANFYF